MNWVSGLDHTLLSRDPFFRTGPGLKSIQISELPQLAHFLCLSTEVATKDNKYFHLDEV